MMEKYEEYYLLIRYMNLSLNEINNMSEYERNYMVNQIKKK